MDKTPSLKSANRALFISVEYIVCYTNIENHFKFWIIEFDLRGETIVDFK